MIVSPGRAVALAAAVTVFLMPATNAAADAATTAAAERTAIEALLGPEAVANLNAAAEALGEALAIESLGHAMLMNRHLDEAVWNFAAAVERDPGRASALTALGVGMLERDTLAGIADVSRLEAIIELHREAAAALPNEAAIANNLGTALLRLARAIKGDASVLLAEAVAETRRATTLDPSTALYQVRLAEALLAEGDGTGAAEALGRAFIINSVDVALLQSRNGGPATDIPVTPGGNACAVNFDCMNTCPGGIIGRIQVINCEIANQDARMACEAGQPYPTAYNCNIEMPRFGIMIPGLYPGFSVVTPWGGFDVIVQGDGQVDWRARVLSPSIGSVQGYVGASGSWQPSSGEATWDFNAGIQYNLFNQNSVMNQANRYDIGTSAVIQPANSAGPPEIRLDVGRGTLLSI